MPVRVRAVSSSACRHNRADRLLAEGTFTMRPCSACVSRGLLCVVSPLDERCEQCFRNQRSCELASPWKEFDRLAKHSERLQIEALEAEAKASRLRKQRRLVLKKMKELDARERTNIEELEIDERLADSAPEPLSDSVQGPRSPSGFFQASSDSLNRTSLVLTSSS
jgi:hypothetical protein